MLKCWPSGNPLQMQMGRLYAYAMMRNNDSNRMQVAHKLADRRCEISVTIENETEQSSTRVELKQKQSH